MRKKLFKCTAIACAISVLCGVPASAWTEPSGAVANFAISDLALDNSTTRSFNNKDYTFITNSSSGQAWYSEFKSEKVDSNNWGVWVADDKSEVVLNATTEDKTVTPNTGGAVRMSRDYSNKNLAYNLNLDMTMDLSGISNDVTVTLRANISSGHTKHPVI